MPKRKREMMKALAYLWENLPRLKNASPFLFFPPIRMPAHFTLMKIFNERKFSGGRKGSRVQFLFVNNRGALSRARAGLSLAQVHRSRRWSLLNRDRRRRRTKQTVWLCASTWLLFVLAVKLGRATTAAIDIEGDERAFEIEFDELFNKVVCSSFHRNKIMFQTKF